MRLLRDGLIQFTSSLNQIRLTQSLGLVIPRPFENYVHEVVLHFIQHISWSIAHIKRTGNEAADVLACVSASGSNFLKFA